MGDIMDIRGIGPAIAAQLADRGLTTIADLVTAEPETLATVRGVSLARAQAFCAQAGALHVAKPAPQRQGLSKTAKTAMLERKVAERTAALVHAKQRLKAAKHALKAATRDRSAKKRKKQA